MDDDEKTPWRVEPRSTENGLWALVNAGSNSLYDVELTGATTADTERFDAASLGAAPSIFNPDAPYRFRLRNPAGVSAPTLLVTWADSPGGRPHKQRIIIQ